MEWPQERMGRRREGGGEGGTPSSQRPSAWGRCSPHPETGGVWVPVGFLILVTSSPKTRGLVSHPEPQILYATCLVHRVYSADVKPSVLTMLATLELWQFTAVEGLGLVLTVKLVKSTFQDILISCPVCFYIVFLFFLGFPLLMEFCDFNYWSILKMQAPNMYFAV